MLLKEPSSNNKSMIENNKYKLRNIICQAQVRPVVEGAFERIKNVEPLDHKERK